MSGYTQITLADFGHAFVDQVFSGQRLAQELNKAIVGHRTFDNGQAYGTVDMKPCALSRQPELGNETWNRVFDMDIPLDMEVYVRLPAGTEHYFVSGNLRMRLWVKAYAPLKVYLGADAVKPEDISLAVIGDHNWVTDVAKNLGDLEKKLKQALADQFNAEFAKSEKTRLIDIYEKASA